MLTILTGIHTIHQDGVLTGAWDLEADSTAADMAAVITVATAVTVATVVTVVTVAIMVAGTILGTLTVGVDILTGVAVTTAADTEVITEVITVAAFGVAELLITAIVFTESKTTPDQADRMPSIMAEEVQHRALHLRL